MRWFLALWLAGCAAAPTPPLASAPLPPVSPAASPTATATATPAPPAETWSYEVVQRYPHDPQAFTQGLWMDPKDQLWETTGLRKQSTLRKVDLESGKFQVIHRLPDDEFGEGLAFSRGTYFWLTWDSHLCHTYDAQLKPLKTFKYEGEGWGLCSDPSGDLWMSNGSDKLVLRDPTSFQVKREISVTRNGEPVPRLNELEWVEGQIYANLYGSPAVAVVDPDGGNVRALIDFTGLLSNADSQNADVLNGIAYQSASKKLWVTGKKWPKLFQVKIRQGP